jgi:hypothetical protein
LLKFFDRLDVFNGVGGGANNNWCKLRSILAANHYPSKLVNDWKLEHDLRTTDVDGRTKPKEVRTPWSFEKFKLEARAARKEVPADGHCLLHCVSRARGTRLDKQKENLRFFLKTNALSYKDFLQQGWQHQLTSYVNKGVWSSDIVDLGPAILADML